MAKKDNAPKEEAKHSNRNLVSVTNGSLQVVSVAHGTFAKLAGKASSVSDIGRIAKYVSACFKKKDDEEDEKNLKCLKCRDVGHFLVKGDTPLGEYTFAVPCQCKPLAKSIMHSEEYEQLTRTVLIRKKETYKKVFA
jgi:hypothetical protein